MFRRRRWTTVAGYVVEDGSHLVQHTVALSKVAPLLERDPCPLVLSISALHLLMHTFLDFALQDTGAGGLVVVGNFQNVCRIDPVVSATAHDMVTVDVALINRNLRYVSLLSQAVICAQGIAEDRSGMLQGEVQY